MKNTSTLLLLTLEGTGRLTRGGILPHSPLVGKIHYLRVKAEIPEPKRLISYFLFLKKIKIKNYIGGRKFKIIADYLFIE